MISRLLSFALLVLGSLQAASLPGSFEPAGGVYIAHSKDGLIEISPRAIRLSSSVTLVWRAATPLRLGGERPTGGMSHYFIGADSPQWRTAPHYGSVRASELYPNVDATYYLDGRRLEFDLILRPGAQPEIPHFDLMGATHVSIADSGDLEIEAGGENYQFLLPRAYQLRGGIRQSVDCRYVLDKQGGVGFRVGPYDHSLDLIIDPVVQALTYLGGSGTEYVQAIGADAAGNIIVAGTTTSVNFPGGGTAASSASIFVTKLNASGTNVLFTTILGSTTFTNAIFIQETVTGLAVDTDGSIFLTGQTLAPNFPVSAGAWQTTASGAFAAKLDNSGKLVYSTYLGPPAWRLTASKIRVRRGIAYLAGNIGATTFLGTNGALQRNVAGNNDFYVLSLAADGSAPVFLTAFGGSGAESLRDMTVDAAGNIILVGTSASADLPLTPDALPYAPPANNLTEGLMVRIDPTGSHLLSSTWLGTVDAGAVAATPDGGLVVAGGSSLPVTLTSGAPHYSIGLSGLNRPSYLAKFAVGSNRPVWTTELLEGDTFNSGISIDAQGNIYWAGYPHAMSGGALAFYTGPGLSELAADGSRVLFTSSIPSASSAIVLATGPTGAVYFGGYTSYAGLPVTPGAVQPQRDPAPAGTDQHPLNNTDGFVGSVDLSSFTSNFFATPPQYSPFSLTWRIGEPAPAPLVQNLLFVGSPGPFTVTSSSRLVASFTATPTPVVAFNVKTSQSVAGTFQESVTVQSQSNPNASLTIPLSLTVLPAVSFDLASTQVNLRYRQGQAHTPTTVAVTPNFAGGYFYFNVDSNANWLYGSVNQSDSTHSVLSINTADLSPGAYDGTLTISLQGLTNASRSVLVHFVVDPPATIQTSTSAITLHIVKGQPIVPAVVTVTGSVPGVQWGIFVGVSRTWLQVTQTSTTTPGEINVTVDPATVETGIFGFAIFVSGEAGQRIDASITVDVSSGSAFDVVPAAIQYQFTRGGPYLFQNQGLAFTAPSKVTVQLSSDQPWMKLSSSSIQTPGGIAVVFDNTLPEGIYHGTIKAVSGSTSVSIPATFTLYDIPHLVFSSAPLNFQWRIGDPLPSAQQLSITCPTLNPDSFQAGATDYPTFLKVDPGFGVTPNTLKLTADPTGLAAGIYKTNLSIRGPYSETTNYPWIPVTFTILPNPNAPKATITRVADAASYLGGAIAPGEVAVLFGSGLGPAALTQSQPGSDGRYPSTLPGWTVYFDELPAPVLYLSDKQAAVMAPFGIAGRSSTSVTVVTGGTTSVAVSVPVAATNPSVFTAGASGSGLASAVNVAADGSLSLLNAATPAPRGGIVTFYVSGMGATTPVMPDGSLAGLPLPQLNAAVRVLVGGIQAELLYAGPAPGQIAGVGQINIRIPPNVTPGSASLLVLAGENPSQPGVTLAIR